MKDASKSSAHSPADPISFHNIRTATGLTSLILLMIWTKVQLSIHRRNSQPEFLRTIRKMSQNQAAWMPSAGAYPFTIGNAAFPKPGPGQVVIKNAAVAIVSSNPSVLFSFYLRTSTAEPC